MQSAVWSKPMQKSDELQGTVSLLGSNAKQVVLAPDQQAV